MSDYHRVLEKPLVTEKSMEALQESNRVSFKVRRNANKIEVRKAVEKIFEVTVESVNVVTVRGKKKDLVKISANQRIGKKQLLS